MSNESAPQKSNRTPWLIGGILGCLVLCLCAAMALGAFYLIGQTPSVETPTRVTQPPTTVPPTALPLTNIVTNAVMAKDVKGDNFDPVGITDAFPAEQKIFHAVVTISNAPANTAVRVVWLSSDNTRMGESEVKTDGSRNLDFTFAPNAGQLPAGNYRVEIYVNGKLDRATTFSVSGAPAKPSSVPSPAAQPTIGPKPSGYVNSVTMAEGTQGADREPANPTTSFKPTAIFHAVVRTQNAPANTKFKASWYLVDAGAGQPSGLLEETEIATDGTRNIDFTLKPSTQWAAGTYRVEIRVNGVLDTVKNFGVK